MAGIDMPTHGICQSRRLCRNNYQGTFLLYRMIIIDNSRIFSYILSCMAPQLRLRTRLFRLKFGKFSSINFDERTEYANPPLKSTGWKKK